MTREWFKVWALQAIQSEDLDALSDHEERVWWRLLMWASLEDTRWHIRNSAKLAGRCASTPKRFDAALAKFGSLGMVTATDGVLFIVNGPKWNEETEKTPKPSTERVRRFRAKKAGETPTDETHVTPGETRYETVSLFEEEEGTSSEVPEEKEQEEEKDLSAAKPPRKSLRLVPLRPDERLSLLGEFPHPGANEQVDLAVSHKAHRNYPDNQIGYVRNWLRRWAGEQGFDRRNGNGNRNTGSVAQSRVNPSARDRLVQAGRLPADPTP